MENIGTPGSGQIDAGVAEAERVAVPGDLVLERRRVDRHVIDVARGRAAAGVALGTQAHVGLELGRRLVELGLPEHLVHVTHRRAEAERAAVPDRVFDPALGELGVDALRDRVHVLRPVGAPADVGERGRGALGDDQARVQPLAPAAQVGGLALLGGLLEAEDVHEPAHGLLGLRARDLDVRQLGQQDLGHGLSSAIPNPDSGSRIVSRSRPCNLGGTQRLRCTPRPVIEPSMTSPGTSQRLPWCAALPAGEPVSRRSPGCSSTTRDA